MRASNCSSEINPLLRSIERVLPCSGMIQMANRFMLLVASGIILRDCLKCDSALFVSLGGMKIERQKRIRFLLSR